MGNLQTKLYVHEASDEVYKGTALKLITCLVASYSG